MEDAHVARTDVRVANRPNTKAKVFAVFDGHGGAEVARFCQMHLVDVLVEQDGWRGIVNADDDGGNSASLSGGEGAVQHCIAEKDDDYLATCIGQALIHSFHALDRLIDDPSKREEIERWRLERPPVYIHEDGHVIVGESNPVSESETGSSAPIDDNKDVEVEMNKVTTNLQDLHLIGDLISQDDYDSDESSGGELEIIAKNEENTGADVVQAAELNEIKAGIVKDINGDGGMNGNCNVEKEGETATNDVTNTDTSTDINSTESYTASSDSLNTDTQDGIVNDDSSDDSDSDEEEPRGILSTDAYSLITKFLPFGSGSRSPPPNDKEDKEDESTTANDDNEKKDQVLIPTQEQLMNPPYGIVAPSASIPTKIMNGRKVCNLPDHPIHAGCTSVVAVMLDKTLVVANAGDSRAVICRAGGLTEPLSFDHKPLQVSGFFVCLFFLSEPYSYDIILTICAITPT